MGWLSDGMTASEASTLRGTIVQNVKKGISPQSVAEMREMKAATDRAEQNRIDAENRAKFTFGEAAEHFLEWSKANKKSYCDDRNRYRKHLEPRLKNIPIRDISPFHLEKLKSALKKEGLAPATIRQCLQLIRGTFNKTRSWGQHDSEFPAIEFPKVSNHRVAFLKPEQADELLTAIKSRSIRLWCQCVLGLYAGLRFGEIAGIELQDIDPEAGIIHIRDPKGGVDRVAYITEPIEKMLAEWWTFSEKKPGLVFPTQSGGRQVNVSATFDRTLKELKMNVGITDSRQKIVFHTLRHTFASWLVMGGESLQTVKELMGHRDIQTTMRYSHLAPDIKRQAADNLVSTLKIKKTNSDLRVVG